MHARVSQSFPFYNRCIRLHTIIKLAMAIYLEDTTCHIVQIDGHHEAAQDQSYLKPLYHHTQCHMQHATGKTLHTSFIAYQMKAELQALYRKTLSLDTELFGCFPCLRVLYTAV